jgi:uncharacterized protein YkwD
VNVSLIPPPPPEEAPAAPKPPAPAPTAPPPEPAVAFWSEPTRSPRLGPPADPQDAPLHALCGDNDLALHRAALAEVEQAGGGSVLSPDELSFTLRAFGEPHVWPRGWAFASSHLTEDEVVEKLTRFVTDVGAPTGVHRCGIARGHGIQGEAIVAAVIVDALADLGPLPPKAKVGETVSAQGTLLVSVIGMTAVVVGPRGAPRPVPVTMNGGAFSLRFVPDQPGAWVLHVRADLQGGSRPLLEAHVYADAEPPQVYTPTPAPGEDAAPGVADPTEALARMIAAARKAEGLPALRRDPLLDSVARAHTEHMVRLRKVAHDVGSGEVRARLSSVGVKAGFVEETVARARDAATVHRAVWTSPEERGRLVSSRARRFGVAAVADEQGTWVTEIFTE